MKMYLADVYTVPANLAGLPAMSLPAGKDHQGMPIGIQLMANRFQDDKMICVAYALEKLLMKRPEQGLTNDRNTRKGGGQP